ncbi:hypothetical protein NC651_017199 [Populus alba x Populus x berolinensis]|nr:hypothetical protein NC651_017199 [Populus alba x Populus x berolinensis]
MEHVAQSSQTDIHWCPRNIFSCASNDVGLCSNRLQQHQIGSRRYCLIGGWKANYCILQQCL